MSEWFDSYVIPENINTFAKDLCDTIETKISLEKKRPKNKKKMTNSTMKKNKWFHDENVKHFCKVLNRVACKWRNDKTDENREALKFISVKTSEIKKKTREKYWLDTTASISRETSLRQVWAKINRTRGKTKKVAAHPNPQGRADEIINKWSWEASSESLPAHVREYLSDGEREREGQVQLATSCTDHTDTPIKEWELHNAIKSGHSTAPGDDGITYDIIETLVNVSREAQAIKSNVMEWEWSLYHGA
ncbi:hypothetical protein Pmani_015605 [Petrolisthes manimaculis]|uniref:Uncharacterized protein n=1 Tax=Petrolisthes manimaculis TaxID=1843537 RepID=A0AAE1U7I3_9EUCA|nr:hypothetical protein Pmani_015605 [Petrolisthes manimaculis]